jgi:signal transduction histidine kinase
MDSEVKILAHDINNQLQVMGMAIESLIVELYRPDTSNKKRAVELSRRLESAFDKVAHICKEALNGDTEVDTNIGESIQEALDFCNSYDVETEFIKSRDQVIKISPTSFERALVNLFKNSIESSADKIFVELRDNSLIVRDNGGGLSKDQLLEFKRGNFSTTKEKGHALGVSSLHNFCKKMDWKLEMSNFEYLHERKKKGLKVIISFPKKLS